MVLEKEMFAFYWCNCGVYMFKIGPKTQTTKTTTTIETTLALITVHFDVEQNKREGKF